MSDVLPALGIGLPVAGGWATPETMGQIAREGEDLGYDSLWTFQRVLDPIGSGLEAYHRAVHDPVVSLAYVASCTERVRLGTATICAPFTAPALLAKTVASLDVLSGGRVVVGLGLGWLPEEYAAAGVPFERRGARMDEYLHCLRQFWTPGPVEFDGEFYTVPRSRAAPLPVQRPHPPILLGGTAAPALRRAGRLADGWICSRQDLGHIGPRIDMVRDGAREAGRNPDSMHIVLRGVPDLLDHAPEGQRSLLQGTRGQVLADLAVLRNQGVTDVFFDLNFSPHVNSTGVDIGAAMTYARRVLSAFAPGAVPTERRP